MGQLRHDATWGSFDVSSNLGSYTTLTVLGSCSRFCVLDTLVIYIYGVVGPSLLENEPLLSLLYQPNWDGDAPQL